MATKTERLPMEASEHVCEIVARCDELLQHKSVRRNDTLSLEVRRLRRQAVEANQKICRAWFADELGPDDPGSIVALPKAA